MNRPPQEPVRLIQNAPQQQNPVIIVQKGSSGFNALMWVIVILIIIVGLFAILAILFTGACCFGVSASSATLATSAVIMSAFTSS